jgi:hypothetical protein
MQMHENVGVKLQKEAAGGKESGTYMNRARERKTKGGRDGLRRGRRGAGRRAKWSACVCVCARARVSVFVCAQTCG